MSDYGAQIMYALNGLLGQMRKREKNIFSADETGAVWHRESDVEILKKFCREGVAQAQKYGHFIVGNGEDGNYIGIPGRFLIAEQPAGGKTGFTLWQPIAGGEEFFCSLEEMDDNIAEKLYGYWIARIDGKTLKIKEV